MSTTYVIIPAGKFTDALKNRALSEPRQLKTKLQGDWFTSDYVLIEVLDETLQRITIYDDFKWLSREEASQLVAENDTHV